MDGNAQKKICNLVVVTDATGSMGDFLRSLNRSLLQFLSLVHLTKKIDRIAIVSYRDYGDEDIIKWSGWSKSFDELKNFVSSLIPYGGGDFPEAAKTAAHYLCERVSKLPKSGNDDMITYVVWYADAPPHHNSNGCPGGGSNFDKELRKLGAAKFDWVATCRRLKDLNIVVFPIITEEYNTAEFYVMMSEITGSLTLQLHNTSSRIITAVTINLLLGLMGCDFEFNSDEVVGIKFKRGLNMENIKSETDCDNLLPQGYRILPEDASDVTETCSLFVLPRPELTTSLSKLGKLIDVDADYCNVVYEVFLRLLTPEDIESLTYNSVFGTLWRALCKRRTDNRRDLLLSKVNDALQKVDERTRQIVSKWIEKSYIKLEDILQIIGEVQVPAIVLETLTELTQKQMLELVRSCNRSILENIMCLMTQIRVVENPEYVKDKRYIPIGLPEGHIFELLPHLMAEGTIFSLRPSIIMAMLAVITNNVILKAKADAFLTQKKGVWLDATVPENYTPEFVKLVMRLPTHYLTPDELRTFEVLRNIHGLTINIKSAVDVVMPYKPHKTQHLDGKVSCVKCGEKRSKTLMTEKNICGLCINEIMAEEKCDADHSYMVECVVCHGIYAVVQIHLLRARPKCYYCRSDQRPPLRKCSLCHNHFVLPTFVAKSDAEEPDDFLCRQCEMQPDKCTKILQVEFCALACESYENRSLILETLGLELPKQEYLHRWQSLFPWQSLFKLKDTFSWQQPLTNYKDVVLEYQGKKVTNTEQVLLSILEWVQQGDPQKDSCSLCFCDIDKRQLNTVCGRKDCSTQACSDCLSAWYGSSKPGHVVLPSSLTCPFCKRQPTVGVLRRYNRQLCTMARVNCAALDPRWYHAWCIGCYQLQPFVEITCAAELPKLDGDSRCEECEQLETRKRNESLPVTWKHCPNSSCQHPVEKTSGCNHITCPLCSTHWCYECDSIFDAEFIYDHMYDTHGGIGI